MTSASNSILLSESALKENLRILSQNVIHTINDYIQLPLLPIGQKITIQKIGVYNWDPIERKTKGIMNYKLFTEINPIEYPKVFPIDFQAEQVTPVVIIDSHGNKYKTSRKYWSTLVDIHDSIILSREKILPFAITVDKNFESKWIVNLIHLVGIKFINSLKPRRR